jgi:hypothetical protein
MWVDELKGTGSGPALVVAGGPSLDRCRPDHFRGFATFGTNYAHRVWPVQMLVVVKDVIWGEVKGELARAGVGVALPRIFATVEDDRTVFQYDIGNLALLVHTHPIRNRLVAGRCGATGTAIHLAHLVGHSPIFVAGADLRLAGPQYHARGYWADTDGFRAMGWRQQVEDCEPVFRGQAAMFRAIGDQLARAGNALYFVSPEHWRNHGT